MKNIKFNEKEWYNAVYLAQGILELKSYPKFEITELDLKIAARELLEGLLKRACGEQPCLGNKTKEILALIEAHAATENARVMQ